MRRKFLAGSLATLATTLLACEKTPQKAPTVAAPKPPPQPTPPPAPPPYTGPDTVKVSLMTTKGEIVLELEARKAPITTANFLRYVDAKKLDGGNFWRAMQSGEAGFVQATASGIKYPPIAHEPTSQTGLTHTNGTISMARYGVGTASNEFTISAGDMTYMDAGRDKIDGKEGDNQGYAAFGRVIKGMSVVRAMLRGKITKRPIESGWDGQMLSEPVNIISSHRVET